MQMARAPHFPDLNPQPSPNSLPAATAAKTNATTDICQVGPFMCTPEGRMQKLMLGGAGLFCPEFPPEIAAFGALRTLDLSVATFERATYESAATVRLPGGERRSQRAPVVSSRLPL
jgi:hypothetical protein